MGRGGAEILVEVNPSPFPSPRLAERGNSFGEIMVSTERIQHRTMSDPHSGTVGRSELNVQCSTFNAPTARVLYEVDNTRRFEYTLGCKSTRLQQL